MLKPLFLFVLFSALAPLTHAQRIVLNPGESQSINGIMVSCGGNYGGGGYGMTACERMARLDNDNLKVALMAGASSCRVESFNYNGPSGEGYACRLMGRSDQVLTQGFDNHSCDNMMNKIRNLMIAGQFDHMCGPCR